MPQMQSTGTNGSGAHFKARECRPRPPPRELSATAALPPPKKSWMEMEGRGKVVGIRGKKYKSWPIPSRREKAEEEEEEGPCGKRGIPPPFPGGGEAMPLPIMVNASFNSPGRSVPCPSSKKSGRRGDSRGGDTFRAVHGFPKPCLT